MDTFTLLPLNTALGNIVAYLQNYYSSKLFLSPWATLNGYFPKVNVLISALPTMTWGEESATQDDGSSPGVFSWVATETQVQLGQVGCVCQPWNS